MCLVLHSCEMYDINAYCTQQDQRKACGDENVYGALKQVSHSLCMCYAFMISNINMHLNYTEHYSKL